MKTITCLIFIYCVLLSGCAHQAARQFAPEQVPALKSGHARIFIFRTRRFAALFHPDVYLDEKPIWESSSGEVVYTDVPVGKHTIRCGNDENPLEFIANEKEIKYLNLGFMPGFWHVKIISQFMNPKYALKNIASLDFEGYVPVEKSN